MDEPTRMLRNLQAGKLGQYLSLLSRYRYQRYFQEKE